ncbi:MAG: NAD(P)/FAD-dependent oxidoreductase [Candidatus Aenigmatarchaeota archaeon]
MKNIKILGGGPAGLSAAINLAKAGYEVDVFERNKDAGHRFLGDLQGLENWSEKIDVLERFRKMNIIINFDCDPFTDYAFYNGYRVWKLSEKAPSFYAVKRGGIKGSLDQGLKKQSLEVGVKIHFGSTIPETKADIIATGPIQKELLAADKGVTFKTKMEDVAIMLFNNKAAYNGYGYLLVTKGYGCLCTVVDIKSRNVRESLEETKRLFSNIVDLDIKNPHNVGGTGCFSNQNIFQKENRLYVGESAGLQDFFWGFGIGLAITSGFLAAKSIIENKNYEKLAKAKFRNKMKAGVSNRFFWENFNFRNYTLIMNWLFKSNTIPKMHSLYNFNHPLQRLSYPIALYYMRKQSPHLRL